MGKKKDKKNNVSVKLIRGNDKISKSQKPDVELYNKLVKEGSKKEERVNPAQLISRVDYPVDVKYNGRVIRFSPRAKEVIGNRDKLEGDLPKGIYLKKLSAPEKKSESQVKEETE